MAISPRLAAITFVNSGLADVRITPDPAVAECAARTTAAEKSPEAAAKGASSRPAAAADAATGAARAAVEIRPSRPTGRRAVLRTSIMYESYP